MPDYRITVDDGTAHELDALANLIAANEKRIDQLEQVVVGLKAQVKEAAHELKDDSAFMRPYSQIAADHVAEHYIGKAGRALIKWIVAIGVGVLLYIAGKTGLIK